MFNFIKKYWLEIVAFVIIAGVLVNDMAPLATWINTNSDGVHLTYAAKYLYPAHKGSAPLYLLLGHLFQMIPLGSDFWRMVLISVIGTMGCCLLIYAIVKELMKDNKQKRLWGILAAFIFVASALVFSQSIIAKYYSLTAMFGLLGYWFVLKKKWLWATAALGAGLATHPIILFFIIPLGLFNFRKFFTWKSALIMVGFCLFYLYVPVVTKWNPSPNMWGNTTPSSQIVDVGSTALMLTGGLAIYDFPKRILDTIGLVGICLLLSLIPIGIWIIKDKHWKNQLTWLFLLPIVYFMGDLAPQTYVYMYPAFAFAGVIAVMQLSKMNWRFVASIVGVTAVMFVFNAYYFNIGTTLDKNLMANEFVTKELPKISGSNAIYIPQQGWEWAAIFPYNKETNQNILAVCTGDLGSEIYLNQLLDNGIKLNMEENVDMPKRADLIAESIIEMNPNVWTTVGNDPQDYGAMVVKASKNNSPFVGKSYITQKQLTAVRWNIDNPYGIITGHIEVSNWVNFNQSNRSMLILGMMGFIGFAFCWFVQKIVFEKKEWRLGNVKDKFKEGIK